MTLPLGLLLAGGLARRMGGGDKPLRTVGGRTLLAHAAARLAPQCDGLLLNANGDPARFAAYGLPVVPDGLPGHPGPLAGILAGLDWAARERPGVEQVVSVAADTPFMPHDLVSRLRRGADEAGVALACAASGGRAHPVIGLWPVAIRNRLRAVLEGGERGIGRFTAAQGIVQVEWPADPLDPFHNANTPEDLEAAERLWQAGLAG